MRLMTGPRPSPHAIWPASARAAVIEDVIAPAHDRGARSVLATALTRGLRVLVPVLLMGLIAAPIGGCSSMFGGTEVSSLDNPDPPEKMFTDADALLTAGNYTEAAKKFEDLERNYPFSNNKERPYARRGMALTSFAYWKSGEYSDAIDTGRRFLSLYQGTEDAAFVQNVISMAYFEQIQGPELDQSFAKKALIELKTLVRLYPTTKYAADAQNRIRVCEDALAASEMVVGRRYLRTHKYLAAINRFKVVITDYQTTAHVEEALMRLTEAYMALGIRGEAQSAAAILGHNFPNSKWYNDSYALLASDGLAPREDTGSSISRVWRSVVSSIAGSSPT